MFYRNVKALVSMCAALSMVMVNVYGVIMPWPSMNGLTRYRSSIFWTVQTAKPTELAKTVINYSKLMSRESISDLINKKFDKTYPFEDPIGIVEALNAEPENLLREIRDMEIEQVHCFYLAVAQELLKQMAETMEMGTNRPHLRPSIIRLIDYSKPSWLKAISSLYSLGVYPTPLLWHMALYTNFAIDMWLSVGQINFSVEGDVNAINDNIEKENHLAQETSKKTGKLLSVVMAERQAARETMWSRMVLITKTLFKWASKTVEKCAGKNVVNWDMRSGRIRREGNVHSMYLYFCPMEELEPRCLAIVPYAFRFSFVLDKNNEFLPLGDFNRFDPKNWLISHEMLENMLFKDSSIGVGFQNVTKDVEYFVKPVFNHGWVLHYPESYFQTIENVLVGVGQILLLILRRNWTVCRHYWRSIAQATDTDGMTMSRYVYSCTAIKPSVDIIVQKMQLTNDTTVNQLVALLKNHFTSDVQFDAAIRVIDLKLSKQNTLFDGPLGAIAKADIEFHHATFLTNFQKEVGKYAKNLPILTLGIDFTKEILDTFREVITKYDA